MSKENLLLNAIDSYYLDLTLRYPMVDPIKCIARVANKAEISEKTKHQAINLMYTVIKNEISVGKDPMGLASNGNLCILHKHR